MSRALSNYSLPTSFHCILQELRAIHISLEGTRLLLQQWLALQGQPHTAVDDRLPDGIEQLAFSPDFGRRTSSTTAE